MLNVCVCVCVCNDFSVCVANETEQVSQQAVSVILGCDTAPQATAFLMF